MTDDVITLDVTWEDILRRGANVILFWSTYKLSKL